MFYDSVRYITWTNHGTSTYYQYCFSTMELREYRNGLLFNTELHLDEELNYKFIDSFITKQNPVRIYLDETSFKIMTKVVPTDFKPHVFKNDIYLLTSKYIDFIRIDRFLPFDTLYLNYLLKYIPNPFYFIDIDVQAIQSILIENILEIYKHSNLDLILYLRNSEHHLEEIRTLEPKQFLSNKSLLTCSLYSESFYKLESLFLKPLNCIKKHS